MFVLFYLYWVVYFTVNRDRGPPFSGLPVIYSTHWPVVLVACSVRLFCYCRLCVCIVSKLHFQLSEYGETVNIKKERIKKNRNRNEIRRNENKTKLDFIYCTFVFPFNKSSTLSFHKFTTTTQCCVMYLYRAIVIIIRTPFQSIVNYGARYYKI